MKTIKFLLLLVAFSTATFYSCSDENAIKNETTAQNSIALRTVLNKLKLEYTVGPNRSAELSANPTTPMLCFDFVFPMTFSYSNGTIIAASNIDGLLAILNSESPDLYLSAVVFPFQVQTSGSVQTINDEADLIALILQCGLTTFNYDLQYSYCFDIVFPVQAGSAGQVFTINSQVELNAYLNNLSNGTEANIIFPITVIDNNQTTVINNIYEFYDLVNSCNDNYCNCYLEYNPVCVQTANGIVEYSNACFAQCAGFTQNDFIVCNPTNACSITNLTTTVGSCNPDGSYALTIDFDYENTSATTFQVINSSNQLVGTYQLSALPITIPSYISSDAAIPTDYLVVSISDTCVASQQWMKPLCNVDCICTTEVNPVCVMMANGQIITYTNACLAQCAGYTQNDFVNCNPSTTQNFGDLLGTCFQMNYPVSVQYQGAIQQVFSNGELLQYWNTANGWMPIMNYPIIVTFGNTVYTFANQAAFESQIAISCP
jgi:hypothetical protein